MRESPQPHSRAAWARSSQRGARQSAAPLFGLESGSGPSKKARRARTKPNLAALGRRPTGMRPNIEAKLNWRGASQAETRADQNFVRPKKRPRARILTRQGDSSSRPVEAACRAAPKTQSTTCPTTAIVPNKGGGICQTASPTRANSVRRSVCGHSPP